jgi:purine-binding chemotaxis protein CheW
MWLLCRVAAGLCALPIDHVIEVMRPLPIQALSGMPQFLLGLCIIRGEPVPVIDAGLLLSGAGSHTGRLVTIAVGGRAIALAVEQVIGIRRIDHAALSMLPPLLQNTAGDAVEAIRALDGDLLLLLDSARIVPAALLDELIATGATV